jgi:hypothetical protein
MRVVRAISSTLFGVRTEMAVRTTLGYLSLCTSFEVDLLFLRNGTYPPPEFEFLYYRTI